MASNVRPWAVSGTLTAVARAWPGFGRAWGLGFVGLCIVVNYRPLRARCGSRVSGPSYLLACVWLQGQEAGVCGVDVL